MDAHIYHHQKSVLHRAKEYWVAPNEISDICTWTGRTGSGTNRLVSSSHWASSESCGKRVPIGWLPSEGDHLSNGRWCAECLMSDYSISLPELRTHRSIRCLPTHAHTPVIIKLVNWMLRWRGLMPLPTQMFIAPTVSLAQSPNSDAYERTERPQDISTSVSC